MKRNLLIFFVLLFALPVYALGKSPIFILTVEGVINPAVSEYIKEGIKEAEKSKAGAIVIELDTPGGLLDATRSIIGSMLNSPLPIIVYVAPRGARATSAGVFITMASDIAAMAPETHIGAAHPVTIGGDLPSLPKPGEENEPKPKNQKSEKKDSKKPNSVMEEKMVSDSAAYIRTLAKDKGRNAEWAEKAVRESVSLTETEAQKENVVELIAGSREELFKNLEGREIRKNGQKIILDIEEAPVQEFPMSWRLKMLHYLAHPNIAYILLTLGFWALVYEFSAPGFGLGGIVGVLCFFLAFFSLQFLPINIVGLVLIIFGLVLFIAELFAPTHGALTLGGIVSFAMGSFMLIESPKGLYFPGVSWSLILPTVIASGLFFGIVIKKVIEARFSKPALGQESLIGQTGVAREDISKEGMVFLNGEWWTASAETPISKGDQFIVTDSTGNKISIKKTQQ